MTDKALLGKRREVARLALARGDMDVVRFLARHLVEAEPKTAFHDGLLTGLVVTYARPFTKSTYRLPEKPWTRFEDDEFLATHKRLLKWRRKVFAHNDENELRKILILPGAAWDLEESRSAEQWRYPKPEFYVAVTRLGQYQYDRLTASLDQLIPEVYGSDWPPGTLLHLDGTVF